MRITVTQKGDYAETCAFLTKAQRNDYFAIMHKYGAEGVFRLEMATPKDTRNTSKCWSYEVIEDKQSFSLKFSNSNLQGGIPVVILLQYGHGRKDGGIVVGRDFINPALKPIFDNLTEEMWREVNR